jgi:hypothetical protein
MGMEQHCLRSQYMWGPIIKYHYSNHRPTKTVPQTIKQFKYHVPYISKIVRIKLGSLQ